MYRIVDTSASDTQDFAKMTSTGTHNKISPKQRVFIVEAMIKTESPLTTKRSFMREFNMQVSKNTIRTIFKTWKTQHTVADLRKGRSGRPKGVRTEENKAVVQDLLQSGSKTSIRKLSASSGIKRTSLNLILRCDLKLNPYKIQQTHEMKPGDDVKRLEFCQRIKELSASGNTDV